MSWPLVHIKDLGKVVTGKTPSKKVSEFFGGNISFVTPGDLGHEVYVSNTPQRITEKGAKEINLVPKDSIMICCIGSLGKIGMAGEKLATNQQINSIIFDEDKVFPKYGYYACARLKSELESRASSTTISIINKSNFEKIEMPLPPLPEQRRIAAILDKANALRRKRAETIKLLDQFLRSVFLEMFGDPVRNSKKLAIKSLGNLAAICRGRFSPRPRNDPKFYGGNYPFIQTGDIANSNGILRKWHQTLNEAGTRVSKAFEEGTVVIAIVGATIGETAILGFKSYFPDSVIGITSHIDLATPEYIEYLLRFWKPIFRARAPETARANINLETIRPLPIPIPEIPLQKKFSKIYQKIHGMILRPNNDLEQFFDSLTQRAFQGEL